ncbi:integration host factor [Nitzschia inconspicua]|uniref:Integration host factor n=1 Tax=Nitzschia inconspicua TaxID=303405 RepID=A0A9K3LDR2_9STRA|nr:integration host factor [Nitzschia inconspicua]
MFSSSKISVIVVVVLLGLFFVLAEPTAAFVNNHQSSRHHRRGARGETMVVQRTSLESPSSSSSTSALHMAPKKKKAKAAAPVVVEEEEEEEAAPPETLRKKDVVNAISERLDMTKGNAEAAVNAVFDVISDIVVEGDRVNIAGFGTFEPRQRSARKGRNPKTGEEISIQASTSCGFSAAKQLKDRMNGKE